jgi:hypothetical protein
MSGPIPVTIVGREPGADAKDVVKSTAPPAPHAGDIYGFASTADPAGIHGPHPVVGAMGERAAIPMPPPQVNVTANTDVKVSAPQVSVSIDGSALAAAVATKVGAIVEKETRITTGVASHDGQESYRSPDQGGIRHQ